MSLQHQRRPKNTQKTISQEVLTVRLHQTLQTLKLLSLTTEAQMILKKLLIGMQKTMEMLFQSKKKTAVLQIPEM